LGFDLADFRELQKTVETISAAASGHPQFAWLPRSVLYSPTMPVGARSFTVWEARREIVRRALEYLSVT
jgi:hypothetical protein